MLADFMVPFIAIALAELGDKTQLTILLLATRTKKHISLAIGVMLAFFLVDGLAIMFGSLISSLIPISILKILAGILFILFGVMILRDQKTSDKENISEIKSPFLSGFAMIFLSEMGDKTQIAAGVFATKFSPILVLAGTMSALLLLSILAIWAGRLISKKINQKRVSKIAGFLFIGIGTLILIL